MECDNGCDRSGKGAQLYLIFLGALIFGIGNWILQCLQHTDKKMQDEMAYSGIDITLLLIGTGVLFTDLVLGDCPDAACVKKS